MWAAAEGRPCRALLLVVAGARTLGAHLPFLWLFILLREEAPGVEELSGVLNALVEAREVALAGGHGVQAGVLTEATGHRRHSLRQDDLVVSAAGVLPELLEDLGQVRGGVRVLEAVPGDRRRYSQAAVGAAAGRHEDIQAHGDHDLVPHDQARVGCLTQFNTIFSHLSIRVRFDILII